MWISLAAAADIATVVTATGPIHVDGVLDEPDWATATPISEFQRFRPTEGGPPPGVTEVRLVQDDKNLYLGFHVADAGYAIRARVSPREDVNADDQIAFSLDPFLDERSGYLFWLNALGIQQDFRVGEGGWNISWDTVFKSKGRVTADGYDVEIAMPWRSLKFPRSHGAPQDWGLILQRKNPATGAVYAWPHVKRNPPRAFAGEGRIVGLKPPSRGSGLELNPGVAIMQRGTRDTVDDPLVWNGFTQPFQAIRPSLDARYGVTANTGLAATINPDFSQLEFDVRPIRLNQRFAFTFLERRPFFLDGVDTLEDPGDALYSRSIGDPVYGLKLHGREGRWVFGLLNALDRSPQASFNEFGAPGFNDPTGASALNTLVRVRRLIGQGSVGVVAAEKDLLRDGVAATNRYGGVDASWVLPRRWSIGASSQGSVTTDHTAAGASISGWSGSVSAERSSGEGTGFSIGVSDRTPGHRVETGYLPQAGITEAWLAVDHTFNVDTTIDVLVPGFDSYGYVERDGDALGSMNAEVAAQLGGIHHLTVGTSFTGWQQSGEVEGAPKTARTGGPGVYASYYSDLTRWLTVKTTFSTGAELSYANLSLGRSLRWQGDATFRPTPNVRLDLTTQHQDFWVGDQRTDANQVRARANWQITREWGLRAISQATLGTNTDPQLVTSALLTWLPSPGTAMYVGYAETTDLDQRRALDRTVFAKGTVLWRL